MEKERTNELNHQNHVGGFLLYDFEILNGTKEKKKFGDDRNKWMCAFLFL